MTAVLASDAIVVMGLLLVVSLTVDFAKYWFVFGISALYLAVRHGFEVHVFPATATHEQVREAGVDCLFLSNGPGDPAALPYIHKTVSALLPDYPTFGICLGHQMITHALGGTTFKLKFGHRGANHPVKDVETGRIERIDIASGSAPSISTS